VAPAATRWSGPSPGIRPSSEGWWCRSGAADDLAVLDRALAAGGVRRLALTHFDLAAHRPTYNLDLFSALRHLTAESRRLVLLLQSRQPFANLLPSNHPLLSWVDVEIAELRGHEAHRPR
jgi:hypothetical protein